MSDTKFTRGPWAVDNDLNVYAGAPNDGSRVSIAKTHVIWAMGMGSVAANAHLIAAAPDMFAALEEVAQILAQCTFETILVRGQYLDRKEVVASARAALAKARGQA